MFLTPFVSAARPFAFWGDIDKEFDRIFEGISRESASKDLTGWEVHEDKDAWTFQVLVPGFTGEQIKIDATPETLSLSGSRASGAPEAARLLRRERPTLEFSRTFQFPHAVDADNATAHLENGVLTVKLPKRPETQPRSIKVLAAQA